MEEKTSHNVNDLPAVPETGAAHIVSESHVISPITATPTPSDVTSPTNADVFARSDDDAVMARSDDDAKSSTDATATITSTDDAAVITGTDTNAAITGTDAAATVTSTDDAAAITGTDNTATITSTDAAAIASPTQPGPVSAHGLVIDYDNSFSLDEIEEFNYRANFSKLFLYLIVLYLNLS